GLLFVGEDNDASSGGVAQSLALVQGIVEDVASTSFDAGLAIQVNKAGTGLFEAMRLTSVGNLGIGTTSPTSLLETYTTSGNSLFTLTASNSTDSDAAIAFRMESATTTPTTFFTLGLDDSDGDKFKISTTGLGTSDRLTIDSTGLLTGNTLQVGGFSSVAYSRFGTGTTTHAGSITTTNDVLISGDLEVDASTAFDGILSFFGEIAPDGVTCSNNQILKKTGTDDWDCAADAGGSVSSNSLDFDEFVNTMLLDANLTINRGGYYIGLGAAPSTVLEVQGTASASYLLTGNTLQVGGFASAAYSRFGTGTTSEAHYITGSSDLFITEDLEVNGSVSFAGPASISNTLYVSTLGNTGNVGIGTTAPVGNLNLHAAVGSDTSLYLTDADVGTTSNKFGLFEVLGATSGGMRITGWSDTNDVGLSFVGQIGNGDTTDTAMRFRAGEGTGTLGSLEPTEIAFQFDNSTTSLITILGSGYVGIGTTGPSTIFEVQGTASASYLLTGNTLQVGGFASVAYSRFGTDTTGYTNFITTTNDLLISGDFEVNATAQFDSFVRVSNNNARAFVITDTGGAREDIFLVDTTASSSNSGLTITAGPVQTGALFELKSSGGTLLTKFSDEGGLLINISSTSAFMVVNPLNAIASRAFTIDTLNNETKVSGLASQTLAFEVSGMASISGDLILGATKWNIAASTSIPARLPGAAIVAYGAICSDDYDDTSDDCLDNTRSMGNMYAIAAFNATVDDVAENFPTLDQSLEPADLVSLDYQEKPASGSYKLNPDEKFESEFVKKAVKGDIVLGVISGGPGVWLGGWGPGHDPRLVKEVPVSLSGRIPAKVSLENGPINQGDRLTASSVPGIAMKATQAGMSIGIALEPLNNVASGSFGKVLTFANLTYWIPASSQFAINQTASGSTNITQNSSTIFDLDTVFNYIVQKFSDAMNIVIQNGLLKVAQIIVNNLTAGEVTAGKLCLGSTCVTEQELKALLQQNGIQNVPPPSPSPSAAPSPSPDPNSNLTPTPSPSPSPDPSSTPLPTLSPTPTPSLTPTPTPSTSSGQATPTPTPIPSPTPDPTPETQLSPQPTPDPNLTLTP
ncbi:MAG: cell surface glycoprotein, partial [Parcubacteria group bacterium Gr01-1014_2]